MKKETTSIEQRPMLKKGGVFRWPPTAEGTAWIVNDVIGPYEYNGSYLIELHRYSPAIKNKETEPTHHAASIWWQAEKSFFDFEEQKVI